MEMKDNQTVLHAAADLPGAKSARDLGQKVFAFDRSYWSFDKNDPQLCGPIEPVRRPWAASPRQCLPGYNNCIFAYGRPAPESHTP